MALVRTITRLDRRGTPQDEVSCTYYAVRSVHLTIESYRRGSDGNDAPTQILQFDKEGAKRLKELIESTFPDL